MEEPEIIYPLDGQVIIPVKAEEVICFWKQRKVPWYSIWMAVELKDGTYIASNRYKPSEAKSLMKTLLKKKDFVFIKQSDSEIFLNPGPPTICGVRFSVITNIGKYLGYVKHVEHGNPYASTRKVVLGKVVGSTVENYKRWKKLQEEKNVHG